MENSSAPTDRRAGGTPASPSGASYAQALSEMRRTRSVRFVLTDASEDSIVSSSTSAIVSPRDVSAPIRLPDLPAPPVPARDRDPDLDRDRDRSARLASTSSSAALDTVPLLELSPYGKLPVPSYFFVPRGTPPAPITDFTRPLLCTLVLTVLTGMIGIATLALLIMQVTFRVEEDPRLVESIAALRAQSMRRLAELEAIATAGTRRVTGIATAEAPYVDAMEAETAWLGRLRLRASINATGARVVLGPLAQIDRSNTWLNGTVGDTGIVLVQEEQWQQQQQQLSLVGTSTNSTSSNTTSSSNHTAAPAFDSVLRIEPNVGTSGSLTVAPLRTVLPNNISHCCNLNMDTANCSASLVRAPRVCFAADAALNITGLLEASQVRSGVGSEGGSDGGSGSGRGGADDWGVVASRSRPRPAAPLNTTVPEIDTLWLPRTSTLEVGGDLVVAGRIETNIPVLRIGGQLVGTELVVGALQVPQADVRVAGGLSWPQTVTVRNAVEVEGMLVAPALSSTLTVTDTLSIHGPLSTAALVVAGSAQIVGGDAMAPAGRGPPVSWMDQPGLHTDNATVELLQAPVIELQPGANATLQYVTTPLLLVNGSGVPRVSQLSVSGGVSVTNLSCGGNLTAASWAIHTLTCSGACTHSALTSGALSAASVRIDVAITAPALSVSTLLGSGAVTALTATSQSWTQVSGTVTAVQRMTPLVLTSSQVMAALLQVPALTVGAMSVNGQLNALNSTMIGGQYRYLGDGGGLNVVGTLPIALPITGPFPSTVVITGGSLLAVLWSAILPAGFFSTRMLLVQASYDSMGDGTHQTNCVLQVGPLWINMASSIFTSPIIMTATAVVSGTQLSGQIALMNSGSAGNVQASVGYPGDSVALAATLYVQGAGFFWPYRLRWIHAQAIVVSD